MKRVLRPVGRVAFATWGEWARSPWLAVPHDAAHSVWPARPPAVRAQPFRFGEPGVLSRVLSEAEYADVTPDRVSASLEYADSTAYWEAAERGFAYGPSPLSGLNNEQRLAARAAGEPMLRKWRNLRTHRLHLGAQAFVCVAVKSARCPFRSFRSPDQRPVWLPSPRPLRVPPPVPMVE